MYSAFTSSQSVIGSFAALKLPIFSFNAQILAFIIAFIIASILLFLSQRAEPIRRYVFPLALCLNR